MLLQDNRPYEGIRVAGIDPGTDTVGVSLIEIDPVTFQHRWITSFTLRGSYLGYHHYQVFDNDESRDARLLGIQNRLLQFFGGSLPHYIAYEDNFLQHSASSFKALIEAVFAIKQASWLYNPYVPLLSVKPTQAKSLIGAIPPRGVKVDNKALVRQGLLNYKPLGMTEAMMNTIDEHGIDSLAIAAYAANQIIQCLSIPTWIRSS